MSRADLDPERGRAVAAELKRLGVKGILITAAEQGYITELACKMPKCHCPEELGGPSYFEPVSNSPWSPTHEHYPIYKKDGGHRTLVNSILAHRLCNRLDHSIRVGRSHRRDLETIRKAREEAIRRSNERPTVVERAATRRKARKASWRDLPAAEMAAHLLATPTISDRVWTDKPRLPGETREAFVRRVLLGDTAPVEDARP